MVNEWQIRTFIIFEFPSCVRACNLRTAFMMVKVMHVCSGKFHPSCHFLMVRPKRTSGGREMDTPSLRFVICYSH